MTKNKIPAVLAAKKYSVSAAWLLAVIDAGLLLSGRDRRGLIWIDEKELRELLKAGEKA